MRIAVSAENKDGLDSRVSHHFGRCPYYILVDVKDQEIENVQAIENPHYAQHEPGMVPGFIKSQNVDVMLSGGMGRRAIGFFENYGIQVATGATGTVRSAVDCFLRGELQGADPCSGHEGGHHHQD